jgi:hypothetical protein
MNYMKRRRTTDKALYRTAIRLRSIVGSEHARQATAIRR